MHLQGLTPENAKTSKYLQVYCTEPHWVGWVLSEPDKIPDSIVCTKTAGTRFSPRIPRAYEPLHGQHEASWGPEALNPAKFAAEHVQQPRK
jgi:hypothetical protein